MLTQSIVSLLDAVSQVLRAYADGHTALSKAQAQALRAEAQVNMSVARNNHCQVDVFEMKQELAMLETAKKKEVLKSLQSAEDNVIPFPQVRSPFQGEEGDGGFLDPEDGAYVEGEDDEGLLDDEDDEGEDE